MKKKSLLFLLLLALFAPWVANAQETMTVCDGTDGNSNVPIYGLYCDEGVKCEYIIPAALLADMENGTISSMKFYIKSISGELSANFTVFMKEVNFTTMTAFTGTTGATTVYNGSISLTGTSTVMDINFSENYTYNGGNLLVGFYQNGTSGYKSVSWTGENQTYASAWAGYGTSYNANGSSKNFLPKTTFTYTPGEAPTCPKPTNLAVSNITSSEATINWGSDGNWFYFEYREVGGEWTTGGVNGTGSTFASLSELEPNTTYEFHVKNICGVDDESDYATTQFTTACGAITSFPWTENFESYAAGNFTAPCWVNEHISGSGTNIFKVSTAANGSNSTHQLQLPDQSSGTLTKLMLPEMNLPGNNYEFVIDVYRSNSTYSPSDNPYEGIRVFASTDGEIDGATELAFIPRQYNEANGSIPAETETGWYTYELPIGISGTCYIILRGENRYCTSTYMDNFQVKRMPSCLKPTGLHVVEGSITAHGAAVEWDLEEDAWYQTFLKEGIITDFSTVTEFWEPQNNFVSEVSWNQLFADTDYTFYVRKYCSETDQSEVVGVSFRTLEACTAPTGLVVSNVTSTGATFTWDAEPGTTFEYFTIEDPWTGFEPSETQNWTATTSNTVGWPTGFSPNSVERFYLRKDCGDDGYSDYIYVEFRTLCGPMSLIDGYAEDFNGYTSVSTGTGSPTGYPDVDLPHCWQFLNRSESSSAYPQAFLSSSSTYADSGNCLFFKSSSTTPLYAILPEFVQDISEYQLTFTYRNEGVSASNGTLYVGYMTDPSDASTFVQTLACPQTTEKTTMKAYFPNAPQGGFMAFKYEGGTSNNYYLGIDNVVVSNGPACFPTGTLSVGELSAHTATLSWDLVDETQDAWVVEYSLSPQFLGEVSYSTDADTHEGFVLTGLEAETKYYVRVRGNCGDGSLSDESNTINFTTLDACPLPTNLVASNLTQNTADLSWTGSVDVEGYDVWFRRAEQVVGVDEQFNTTSLPDRWERKTGLLSDIMDGGSLISDYHWYFGTSNGVFDSHAFINIYGNRNGWLITPSLNVKSGDIFTFDLALTAFSGTLGAPATTGSDDRFVVLATIDNGQTWTILREWNNSGSEYVYNNIANSATGEQVSIDLNEYVGWDVRIAFYGESTTSNADNNLHIDNVKIGTSYAAGGDNLTESFTTDIQLVGLEANTIYDVQVRSKCSDTWTDIFNFKTLDQYTKVFIGGQPLDDYDLEEVSDKWWNPNNWVPYGMPGAVNDSPNEDVILRHDAVISINLITGRNIIADANSITFEGTPKPTLTLEDGNQLRLNTIIDQPDVITVKKNIIGYAGTKDQYYLISSPVQWAGQYNPANGIVTTESDYDLYAFDPAASDGLEWRNYKADPTNFKMDWGTGYLYANAADVMISVTGPVMDNKQPDEIFNYNYYENEDYQFNGWKLCGNTFTCNAYLSSDSQTMAFYRMNADGTGFEVVTSVIKPMEGFFIQNNVNGESVVLSRTAPSKGVRCLNLVLSQVAARRDGVSTGSTTLDNAIIRFDEGNTLEKLSFREGSSKVYMPVEGKDYAVVNAGQMGELPVSFKAESNGTYSLSFTNEDVEFSYLHLIDNLTGNDVDLLANPSYSFEAKTTDYASRFRLVFATGTSVEGDNFSFVNASGNLCIFGIEGEATVQVIDILGHVISSETFSGSYERKINGAPGVYMVRLINGNDVKVQKVVVR